MGVLFAVILLLLRLFQIALICRFAVDMISGFAPRWRPKGLVLVLVSAVFAVTDKPLSVVRRVVPPLNLGGVSVDLGFFLLYFAVTVLQMLLPSGL